MQLQSTLRPAPWEIITFGCPLIRNHVEFASPAIENSYLDFSLRIVKKGGVDAGVQITKADLSTATHLVDGTKKGQPYRLVHAGSDHYCACAK